MLVMARKRNIKMDGEELSKAINEAKKDPRFMKEIDEFIKITTNIYKMP